MDYDLTALKIEIACGDTEGRLTGFYFRAVSDILKDKDPYELQHLKAWFEYQLYQHLDLPWNATKLTPEHIKSMLQLLEYLKVKPVKCIYEPENDHEIDEQTERP